MNKNKRLALLLGIVLVLLAGSVVFLWTNYGRQTESYTSTGFSMGSIVQQTVYGKNSQEAATKASAAINGLDSRIAWREESSDISALNEQAGVDWITLDEQTIALLELSLDVAKQSQGAFDPTILPLSALWNFDSGDPAVPMPEAVADHLTLVGYNDLRVNAETKQASLKRHDMGVDLGAIGKGAACDTAVEVYRQAGVQAAIVAVGGSVGLYGEKSNRQPWLISIRDPNSSEGAEMGALSLSGGFVSTSGSYEKTFELDGKTYHHLLDPKTGFPCESDLVSVTVVCDSGAKSDALSTACFVLGLEEGTALLEHYGAGGIFIDRENRVTVTPSLRDSFRLVSQEYTLAAGE